jgi:beta-lactamase class D
VWYFQRLAKQVGEAHYHDYLKRFNYGNQDISSGVTDFWLGKSLEITPEEQLTFLQKLYRNQLPVSSHATETVKKILVLESSAHSVLSGKTGSASVEGVNIGWFIGHLSSQGKEYLFVNNLTQKGNDAKIDNIINSPIQGFVLALNAIAEKKQ